VPPEDVPPLDDEDQPLPPQPADDEVIVDGVPPNIDLPAGGGPRRKVYVDGVGVTILAERVEYLDENGRLITETLRDFTKKALKNRFASLDDFLRRWSSEDRKQIILDELSNEGLSLDPLAEEVGRDLDPFDLICYVAFDQPALTAASGQTTCASAMSSPNTAPRPALFWRCCYRNIRIKASSTWATHGSCRFRRLTHWVRQSNSSESLAHAPTLSPLCTNSNQPFINR